MIRSLGVLRIIPRVKRINSLRPIWGCINPIQTEFANSKLQLINVTQVRQKYHKTKKIEEEEEADSEEWKGEVEKEAKVLTTTINSLRADLVIKAGLNMARNKIELAFYESRLRINEKRLTKKSAQVNIGDEIDVIKSLSVTNPNHLVISRVVVLSATEKGDAVSVTLKRFKTMLVENYPDPWKPVPA